MISPGSLADTAAGNDQAALSVLPALAFFEAHSAPTFIWPLSAASLRSATPTQAQEDCLLPDAVWTNAAAAADSHASPGSWLEHRLDGDGQRAIRGLLLALLWQLEQQETGLGEETIGRSKGRNGCAGASRVSSAPLLVRCHAGEPGDETPQAWSTYVVAATLLPRPAPSSPSYFNGSASHPLGSSTSGNTPTQAGQAPTPMPGDGQRKELPSALVVLQLHPVPKSPVARSVPTPAQRASRTLRPSPHTALLASGKPLSGAAGASNDSRSAHPTPSPGANPPAAASRLNEVSASEAPRPLSVAAAGFSPLRAPRTETREEKVAWRKRKFNMKETVHRLLADDATSPIKKADQTAVFKSALAIVLNTETESTLWWSDEHIALYNDAYADMLGSRHPDLLGKGVREGWKEIADELGRTYDRVLHNNETLHRFNETFFLNRELPNEEVFQTWSLIPVEDENGKNVGILNRSWETTKECLAERRLLTLRELAQNTASATNVDEFARAAIASLAVNPNDLPFVALYVSDAAVPTVPGAQTTPGTTSRLHLRGRLGIPEDHSSLPNTLSIVFDHPLASTRGSVSAIDRSVSGTTTSGASHPRSFPHIAAVDRRPSLWSPESHLDGESEAGSSGARSAISVLSNGSPTAWPIRQAIVTNENVFVEDCSDLVQGFEIRSFGELPHSALVIPSESDGEDGTSRRMVIVLGLNPRRPHDADAEDWLRLLRRSLVSGLSAIVNRESQVRRTEELAQLDRAKTQFFSNVSHELRTPLTLIAGPIKDLLQLQREGSIEKELLTVTHRNVQRLGRLVDMLMDVSRVEAGRMQGLFSPRQLGRLTADLASLFRSAIEKAGLEFEVEWDEDETRCAYVDSDLWEKICFNLIGNAFKYTLKGMIKIFIRYREKDVEFGVEDTGVGIPSDDVPKVVQRFHRVATTARSHEGTGVGLSLTTELVTLHGGQLEVVSQTAEESPDGSHGSVFVVRLPLGSDHLPVEAVDETIAPEPIGTSRFTNSILEEASTWIGDEQGQVAGLAGGVRSGVSNKSQSTHGNESAPTITDVSDTSTTLFWAKSDTVMIVDDNYDMRRYLRAILEPFVTVLEAKDGQDALDAIANHPPDLILTDHMMPVLDGPGLIKAAREHPSELALCPIILITARAGELEKVEGLTSGADDYLPKPFSSRELVARCHLQMQMGKRRIDLERRFAERTLELKVRAIEAEAKRKEADEQRRQQELLVDVTSHELRNPVSAILNNASLVSENLRFLCSELQNAHKQQIGFKTTSSLLSMIEEDIEALEAIYMMAQSQERIANDVLSLARIQISTLEIFPVPLDLIAETTRICAVFASECRLKQIQLTLVHGESLRSLHKLGFQRIHADSGRLAQVIINLLSNAIRFTTPAPVRKICVTIEVRKNPPDDDTCIPPPPSPRLVPTATDAGDESDCYIYGSVADSGPGLSPEELARLFQRFKQASAQTHVVFGGSGLGLYVCRKICDLMDGKIEVVSLGREEGSTFRFYVKAALGAIVRDRATDSPVDRLTTPEPAKPVSSPTPTGPMSRAIVLIVEDNPINQKVLLRQLTKASIRAELASDGAEALAKILERAQAGTAYASVLLDINMPVMDGLTCIREIRTLEREGGALAAGHLPVFALTGNARQGQIDEALKAGMDDVILKPYKIDDLLAKLRTFL